MCLLHGFGESQSTSMFEAAIMFALNGFRTILIDMKGSGYSSGVRGTGHSLYENHEFMAQMLKDIKSSLPLFIYAHGLGA